MKNYWLLKSEPGTYSFDDLKHDTYTEWTGIRNFQARNYIREMRVGDLCLIYHTGDEKAVVGVAKVASEPYADKKESAWTVVDVAFVKKFKRAVTLAEVKGDPGLRSMALVKAARLSVQPVDKKHFDYICKIGT